MWLFSKRNSHGMLACFLFIHVFLIVICKNFSIICMKNSVKGWIITYFSVKNWFRFNVFLNIQFIKLIARNFWNKIKINSEICFHSVNDFCLDFEKYTFYQRESRFYVYLVYLQLTTCRCPDNTLVDAEKYTIIFFLSFFVVSFGQNNSCIIGVFRNRHYRLA